MSNLGLSNMPGSGWLKHLSHVYPTASLCKHRSADRQINAMCFRHSFQKSEDIN